MGAPKTSKAFHPLWEELFTLSYDTELSREFETEKEARAFQRTGYYYRAARRAEEIADKSLQNLVNLPANAALGSWLNKAERIEIIVRPLDTGKTRKWQVVCRNKLDDPMGQALSEMVAEGFAQAPAQAPAQSTFSEPATGRAGDEEEDETEDKAEDETSDAWQGHGIPDAYRTGQD